EVSLEFMVNDEKYRVVRRLVGILERPEVELYRGNSSESVGVNETRRYVGELLGLDWRGFLTSFLARQQELNALSDLRPSERRDHLVDMLGIEQLDKAIQKVKEDTRLHERQASFLERQIAETGQIELRIKELSDRIAQLSSQVNGSEESLKQCAAVFSQAQKNFLEAQQTKSDWLQIKAKLEAEEKTKAHLSLQLENYKAEVSQLASFQQELEGLEEQLAGFSEAKQRLEAMKLAKCRLEMRSELAAQINELQIELEKIKKQLASQQKVLAEYDRQLSSIPENVQELLRDNNKRLEDARSDFSRLRTQKVSKENELNKLQQQMVSIARFGPESKCERCLRPLGDSLPQIKAHLKKEMAQLEKDLDGVRVQLEMKEKEGQKLKTQGQELETKANVRYELTVKKEACLNELKSLLQREETIQKKLTNMSTQLDQLKGTVFDEAQFSALAEKVSRCEQIQSRYDQLKGSLSRLPAVNEALKDYSAKLSAAVEEVSRLSAALGQLTYDDRAFESSRESFEAAQRDLENVKNKHLTLTKELELTQKELEGKKEQLERFKQSALEFEECRTNQYYGEKLASLFSQFRTHLIASIRPTLSDISSRLMSEMTNGKYSLINLDEKYNLRVMDYGQYFGVERFSGGEKDLANLCLRLAISLALTESAGLSRSFIILDEVFGSQDNERKELIVKALANLKPRFPQILLITHVEDLKDRVEQLIEILPTDAGWSEIRINGNTAQPA
ncbi:MAG: hypothetical protein ACE5K8_06640, partial [Candidatus Zixiibacteriota bacterium]